MNSFLFQIFGENVKHLGTSIRIVITTKYGNRFFSLLRRKFGFQ